MSSSVSKQTKSSSFNTIPQSIATSSILPYITSNDWLNFRLASRSCYQIVHGTNVTADGSSNSSPSIAATSDGEGSESEALWRLALVREYQFDESEEDEEMFHQCIKPNLSYDENNAFLSTSNLLNAPNSFISWKHWRKIDLIIHEQRNDLGSMDMSREDFFIEPKTKGSLLPPSERVNGPYFLRAADLWKKIEAWCDDESKSGTLGRYIKQSLIPGKPLDPNPQGRIRGAKSAAFKAVYSFYAGQDIPYREPDDVNFRPFVGLFGGFGVYDLLSTSRWREPDFESRQSLLSDYSITITDDSMKVFSLDLTDGHIELVSEVLGETRLVAINECEKSASLLHWFEEHANRLQKGFLSVGKMYGYDSILRYPTVLDTANCSRAVTRGVEIVASSIFVPEAGLHAYSIRIRVLTPADSDEYMTPQERGFETCQLVSRHWKISSWDNSLHNGPPNVENVRGEGVVGMYPLLFEGGFRKYETGDYGQLEEGADTEGWFSYQSCSQVQQSPCGFIEGFLHFRPGSISEPRGDLFDVRVDPFPLKIGKPMY